MLISVRMLQLWPCQALLRCLGDTVAVCNACIRIVKNVSISNHCLLCCVLHLEAARVHVALVLCANVSPLLSEFDLLLGL